MTMVIALIAGVHVPNDFLFHAHHLCRGVLRGGVALPVPEGTKLAGCHTVCKFPARIAVAELPHTPVKHGLKNGSFVLNSRALEYVVAGVGSGLLRRLFRVLFVLMNSLLRLCDHSVGLVAELFRQIAVPLQYHFLRLDSLLVARPMRGNLCGACTISANFLQMFLDLLAPRT